MPSLRRSPPLSAQRQLIPALSDERRGATTPVDGLREGVLLEAGFAKVTPNEPKDICSWAYDYAADKVEIIDNRAKAVACYDPGYTLVEKLQTISTKYRKQQEDGTMPVDFMRHYYDVYSLLRQPSVQAFVGTPPYRQHKDDYFPQADNKNIRENAAFQLPDKKTRELYERAYEAGRALYYQGKPSFTEILAALDQRKDRL